MWGALFEKGDKLEMVGEVEDDFGDAEDNGESSEFSFAIRRATEDAGAQCGAAKDSQEDYNVKKKRKKKEKKEKKEKKDKGDGREAKRDEQQVTVAGVEEVGERQKIEDKKKKKKKKKKKEKEKKEKKKKRKAEDDDEHENSSKKRPCTEKESGKEGLSEASPSKVSKSSPAAASSISPILFPYEVDESDHCESPQVSYGHIAPLVRAVVSSKPNPKIYDPYYCDGGASDKLKLEGFTDVHHEKVDFYRTIRDGNVPPHDVFLTNPPYSGDHVEKLMSFLCLGAQQESRPFFLLMPQFVHKHEYYQRLIGRKKVFYIVPKKRYVYEPPPTFRKKKKSDTHKKSSPFVSMWYCWGGNDRDNERIIKQWMREEEGKGDCQLARSKSALRDLRRKGKGAASPQKS